MERTMTSKQKMLLDFIKSEIDRTSGVPPSYEEMMNFLGLKSKSGVHRLIHGLKARGLVDVMAARARGVYPSGYLRTMRKSVPADAIVVVANGLRDGSLTRNMAAEKLLRLAG